MALKTFKFGIGEGYQEISLPEEHILQVIEGNEVPKLDDVQAATEELENEQAAASAASGAGTSTSGGNSAADGNSAAGGAAAGE